MENKKVSFNYKPHSIDEIIGQEKLVSSNGIVRKMIEKNKVFSIIFYGSPGIGKTTIAKVICEQLKKRYYEFNPTVNSKKDLDEILSKLDDSEDELVLIIDEYHRMNRDKQDILLSYLENKKLILFATTTENPFFVINPAIRSRCTILKLEIITIEDIKKGLRKIANKNNMKISDELLEDIAMISNGDLRRSINALEILYNLYDEKEINEIKLNDILGSASSFINKEGNEFHDLKSALHKSIRGSDPDAAIYYLARLIKTEDLVAINRRLIACAYEDIGLANPTLPPRVFLATQAAEKVGFPEANQILANAVIEMCLSPKSNSAYLAINQALADNENGMNYKIPEHICDNNYASSSKFNEGKYLYPHNYENGWVKQDYLPKELKNKKYYEPLKYNNIELKLVEHWKKMKGE